MIYKKGTAPATSEGDRVTSAEVIVDYITLSNREYMALVSDSAMVWTAKNILATTSSSYDVATMMRAVFGVPAPEED